MAIDRVELEQFLYREARLLDQGKLDEWLALFTSDAVYWLPAGGDDIDPTRHVSIIYDDRAAMGRRVARLKSGHAHAQDPPSRTHRVITNVEVTSPPHGDGAAEVTCMMALFELRRHKQNIHSARCTFRLRRESGQWQIALKKVSLLKNNEALEAIPYLV